MSFKILLETVCHCDDNRLQNDDDYDDDIIAVGGIIMYVVRKCFETGEKNRTFRHVTRVEK